MLESLISLLKYQKINIYIVENIFITFFKIKVFDPGIGIGIGCNKNPVSVSVKIIPIPHL